MLPGLSSRLTGAVGLLFLITAAIAADSSALPQDMQAVRAHGSGGPEVLRYERAPLPGVADDQVLIRVRAAGVNPIDWKLRERGPRGGAGNERILGFDAAGVIAKVGKEVQGWRVGDEVVALTSPAGGGAYAEYVAAFARDVARKPKNMTFEQAAGLPVAVTTVWSYLVRTVDSLEGKRLLIHGGAGGVGSVAVQIAKARGAIVIATASARNHDYLRSIGADETIDYTKVRFEQAARDIDIVFDTVGGETLERSYVVPRRGGTLISIAGRLNLQQCTERGLDCPPPEGNEGAGVSLEAVRALSEAGKFSLNVDRTFPLAQAAQAQELNRAGRTRGKIILVVGN
ncbi:MAG TPA: NADP-dependent oxidoreductase [Steroidobacteraceae bacterium]|nr:NADP-dependent oxidoreductase [Steroidobacteraceae bacterium]